MNVWFHCLKSLIPRGYRGNLTVESVISCKHKLNLQRQRHTQDC